MSVEKPGAPQISQPEPENLSGRRDPEERPASEEQLRDKGLDKTIADSFPTSDPPSSIPDPKLEEVSVSEDAAHEKLLADLPPGSWAALSVETHELIGTGATREEAEKSAREKGYSNMSILRVPQDSEAPGQAA